MTEKDSGFHSGERPDPYDGGAEMPFARPERDVIGLGCEKPQALTCYIILHIEPPGRLGYQYDAIFRGELIATSHDPEFAAARALRDRGYSGPLQFFRLFMSGPEPALTMKDLVHSADYCATPDGRFKKYQPFDPQRRSDRDPVSPLAAGRSSAGTSTPRVTFRPSVKRLPAACQTKLTGG